jgi:hypothetical protein
VESNKELSSAVLRQAPTGALHLSYLSGSSQPTEVRHAVWNGTTWAADAVDPAITGDPGCLSLAVDGASRPHILYADTTTKTIVLADGEAGAATWRMTNVRTLDADEAAVLACALTLDSAGAPHIAYAIANPGGNDPPVASFNYAILTASGWATATVAAPPVPGCNVSHPDRTMELVLDAAGNPHITYTACGTEYVHLQ